jgi:hypothetical protein
LGADVGLAEDRAAVAGIACGAAATGRGADGFAARTRSPERTVEALRASTVRLATFAGGRAATTPGRTAPPIRDSVVGRAEITAECR